MPNCDCEKPAFSNTKDIHAALGHLLVLLRTRGMIADPPNLTPIDEELQRFDDHMDNVRGLAAKTRKHYISIIRSLLLRQFADQAVEIATIKPEEIRQFVATQSTLCHMPAVSVHRFQVTRLFSLPCHSG